MEKWKDVLNAVLSLFFGTIMVAAALILCLLFRCCL